jgi:uncharacterized protein (TIGR03034 family)
MTTGYWIVKGDKTSCGGVVHEGTMKKTFANNPVALNGSKVSCGKHPGSFIVAGGHPGDIIDGFNAASTLYSRSSCPCRAFFIPSQTLASHGLYQEDAPRVIVSGPLSSSEPVQHALAAKKKDKPAPLLLPAVIYQTERQMDDYQAKDMYHGDLDILSLRNTFRLNVDSISMKVNPVTLTLKDPADPFAFSSPYVHPDFHPKPMPSVSRDKSAVLMFNEFRELAKVFSFHGPYKNLITEMIDHMQGNSGTPYSSPLLDRALKEQILNDHSEKSSLLGVNKALKSAINIEYGFIPLVDKGKFNDEIKKTILPKFDRQIDRTNGLVITVHDTWATHIMLESLEVEGDSYRAKVHYHIQDHFGLDDADVLNPVYREFRIFRLWFALQRWDLYGYKPFITEMNTTVEISGRLGE